MVRATALLVLLACCCDHTMAPALDDDLAVRRAPRPHGVPLPAPTPDEAPPALGPALGGARAERSANLSHIAGAGRKIMMYVRNRHLQILPDGTVNGTDLESSDYAVLQRTSVNKVQVKMQGVATCLFLCMDACGLLYGSVMCYYDPGKPSLAYGYPFQERELTDDCVFNELLGQHYYNTYSSAKYSSETRGLFLALDRRGAPRRVQLRRDAPPGRLAAYTRVLTKPVPAERVADLLGRLRGTAGAGGGPGAGPTPAPHFRHRGHHAACPPHGHPEPSPRRPLRCPRPGPGPGRHSGSAPRVKHQRRRPGPASNPVGAPRAAATTTTTASTPVVAPAATPAGSQHPATAPPPRPPRRKCEATEVEDLCHKRLQMIAAKKRKSRNEKKHWPAPKRVRVVVKKAPPATTTAPARPATRPTLPPSPAALESGEPSEEEDHDGEEEEDHEDSATMTTEVAITTASSVEVSEAGAYGAVSGSAAAADP